MSNSYTVGETIVTPGAGGWYVLTHPSAPQEERVQGKENADRRAAEINAAAASPEGMIPPQGDLVTPAGTDELQKQVAAMRRELEELRAAQPGAPVETAEGPDASSLATVPREFAGEMSKAQKKTLKSAGVEVVTIVLEENESIPPTGLFISHNGRAYMIKPGEEVDVPDFLLSVLDDAITSSPVVDSGSQKIIGYRDRSKYPYRRV